MAPADAAATEGREEYFTASDGASLFTRTWGPADGRRAVASIHLHHGLGEHSLRYAAFAARLVEEGFVVVAHDARGHGRTAEAEGSPGLGRIAAGPEGAVPRMVADLAEMLRAEQAARPDVPLFVLGHSFGTVISQLCLGCGAGGARVAGLVLSAPPARVPGLALPAFRLVMAGLHRLHGEHGISSIPSRLSFDKFQAKCLAAVKHDGNPTGWEWLNRDGAEVDKYIEDPYCGHDISVGFWTSAVCAFRRIKTPEAHAATPPDLPVCILAGEHDFCLEDELGGKSYDRIRAEMASMGKATPKIVVYPGARHELLLEQNRAEVAEDALRFLQACAGRQARGEC